MELRIGTSGWSYKDWVGPFYPEGSKQADWLGLYAETFDTVEVDSTWYATPRVSTVKSWRERTPNGFLFAAKFPREITHERSLEDCETPTREFLGTLGLLEDKCGPLLLQFPYGFKAERRDDLLAYLDTLVEPEGVEAPEAGFRFAVEVRHRSWLGTDLLEQLAERSMALCLIDHPWFPKVTESTADFLFVRWLGDRKKIESDFSHERDPREADFRWWTSRLAPLAQVRRLFGYVNNHYTGFGPAAARRMKAALEEAA